MKKLYKNVGVMIAKMDEGYVAIFERRAFRLNYIAVKIFSMCNGENTQEDICSCLHKIYPDESEACIRSDVSDIVNKFIDLGMVEERVI